MLTEPPWLVISPHFDDAVLSCGHFLASNPGSVVATVCGGRPGPEVPACQWDAVSGFGTGSEAALARRAEDAEALRILGSQQVVLGFLDGEYLPNGHMHEQLSRTGSRERALEEDICALIDGLRPRQLVFPLGLAHRDHVLVGDAVTAVIRSRSDYPALAYVDLPYAISWPNLVEARLQDLNSRGVVLPTRQTNDVTIKAVALNCYQSQLKQLDAAHPRWRKCLDEVDAEQIFKLVSGGPLPSPRMTAGSDR